MPGCDAYRHIQVSLSARPDPASSTRPTIMSTHQLTHTTDPDGREVVGVRLSNRPDVNAWIYRDDYDRIVTRYGTPSWLLTGNGLGQFYVRFHLAKGLDEKITVARAVLRDIEKSATRYLDGNPLNLRKSNLTFTHGRGGLKRKRS